MLHFRRIRISLGPGNKRLTQGKRDFPWKKLHFYLENFRGFRGVCGSQDVMRCSCITAGALRRLKQGRSTANCHRKKTTWLYG